MIPTYVSAVDLLYGTLYCYRCKDHIYDDDFEKVAAVRPGSFFGLYACAFALHHIYMYFEAYDVYQHAIAL